MVIPFSIDGDTGSMRGSYKGCTMRIYGTILSGARHQAGAYSSDEAFYRWKRRARVAYCHKSLARGILC
jgi:hypothetical protein